MNRRQLILPALMVLGTTLTAVSWLRKPPTYPVARPVADPAPETPALGGMEGLVETTPPKPLPAIAFQDADGGHHDLSEFRGRPVLLNLWATWCQPCIAELPSLAALARTQGPDGIAVVALSTDRGGVAQVRKFLAAHAIDLPIRVDPVGASGEALGARGLPTTLVIDREGRERARLEGAADWAGEAAKAAILRLAG